MNINIKNLFISAKFKQSLAFTLAEVLIVIGILGLIAEMVIPPLIENSQKQAYITQLKKFYSEFSQGLKLYMLSEDCPDLKCTGLFIGTMNEAAMSTAMHKTFKIVKECIDTPAECQKDIHYLGNTDTELQFQYGYVFTTLDGFQVEIIPYDCGNMLNTTTTSKLKEMCAYALVDVNGARKPDTYGRDVYGFFVANDGILYPRYGSEYAKAASNTEDFKNSVYYWGNYPMNSECGQAANSDINSVSGRGCSARIMEQSWQMNY